MVAIGILVSTSWGSSVAIKTVAKIYPGKLAIKEFKGRLASTIDLRGIHFENDKMALTIDRLHLKSAPGKLLSLKVPMASLEIDNMELTIKGVKQQHKSNVVIQSTILLTLGNAGSKIWQAARTVIARSERSAECVASNAAIHVFENWIATADIKQKRQPRDDGGKYIHYLLIADNLLISNLVLRHPDRNPITIDQVYVNAKAKGKKLTHLDIKLSAQETEIVVKGEIAKKDFNLFWQLQMPNVGLLLMDTQGALESQGEISGNSNTIQMAAELSLKNFISNDIKVTKITAKTKSILGTNKKIDLDLTMERLNIHSIILDKLAVDANVQAIGNRFEFHLTTAKNRSSLFKKSVGKLITLNNFQIDGSVDKHGLIANILTKFEHLEPLTMKVQLPKFKYSTIKFSRQPIIGELHWQTSDLKLLGTFFPTINNLRGIIIANLQFDGLFDAPKISGAVNLSNGSLQIPAINIALTEINLNVSICDNKFIYQGNAHSSDGALTIAGESHFTENRVKGDLNIEGKNFLLANTEEYHIVGSPRLSLKFINNNLDLRGELPINRATIKPLNFGIYDALPTELVYTNRHKTNIENIHFAVNINLDLGEQTYIDIMGIEGKIRGRLNIVDNSQQITIARGKLWLQNAIYRIYEQRLKITKGELRFLDSPLSEPEVLVEAIKEFSKNTIRSFFDSENTKLTIGAKITGLLSNPKTVLFSEPPGLNNADILSYLVTGQPVDNISDNATKLLLQFAATMNIRDEKDTLLNRLKEKFALSEFGFVDEITANETTNVATLEKTPAFEHNTLANQNPPPTTKTAFVLGKYLAPKIWVGYSIGLANQIGIFRIKYYLNKYFALRSESDNAGNSAVDLIYTIER